MRKMMLVLLALAIVPGYVQADPVLDENTVKAISQEFVQAIQNGDISVYEKYLYPGSKIVMDLDPSISAGQTEVSYDDFMAMTSMGLSMLENADIHDELISISVDEGRNEATIVEKSTAVMDMMGIKLKDVSIGTITYGVVDGQIKVLSMEDQLISTGPVD